MAVELQLRRDTTANIASASAPLQGEVWMDTNKNQLTVGDGSTPGGWPIGIPVGPSGENARFVWIEKTITLSTSSATNTFTFAFPSGYYGGLLLSMATIVETTITGTGVTGYEVGYSGNLNNFAYTTNLNLGSTTVSGGATAYVPVGLYSGGPNIILTTLGAVPTAGAVKLCALVLLIGPPTS